MTAFWWPFLVSAAAFGILIYLAIVWIIALIMGSNDRTDREHDIIRCGECLHPDGKHVAMEVHVNGVPMRHCQVCGHVCLA